MRNWSNSLLLLLTALHSNTYFRFTWHKRSPSAKSVHDPTPTTHSQSPDHQLALVLTSIHSPATDPTQIHLYKVPTHRISNISPRWSQMEENSVPRFTDSALLQTIQFQFQFIHPTEAKYNWYRTCTNNRTNAWNFRLQTRWRADWCVPPFGGACWLSLRS
jgi:hypothetical protein